MKFLILPFIGMALNQFKRNKMQALETCPLKGTGYNIYHILQHSKPLNPPKCVFLTISDQLPK